MEFESKQVKDHTQMNDNTRTTETFARFISDTQFEDIPREVIDEAKKVFLDCIGVTLAGAIEPAGKIITDVVRREGSRPEASIVGGGFKTSAPNAALANGVIAHALDYDDGGHPSIPSSRSVTVLPAVLGLAESIGATGKELLLGYIVGFEVVSKVSYGISARHHYEWGWQTTGTVCTLGAAAGAAKILNLNAEETQKALGIAGSGAGGLRQNNGTMTKPLHAGNAARNGVLAAILSREGFTGTHDVLEGEFGFSRCFCGSEGYDLNKMTEKLGKTFEFITPGIGLKRYPACMSNHRSLDAIFNLIESHGIHPDRVEKVTCGVSKKVIDHLFYVRPQRGLEGKFSLQYCLAAALLDGKVGLEQFSDKKVKDPRIHDLLDRISVYEHPELKNVPLGKNEFSEVTVYLKDGQIFSTRVTVPRGRPSNPLEYDEIVSKYKACACTILSDADTEKLLDRVAHLESLAEISELTDIIRHNPAA